MIMIVFTICLILNYWIELSLIYSGQIPETTVIHNYSIHSFQMSIFLNVKNSFPWSQLFLQCDVFNGEPNQSL